MTISQVFQRCCGFISALVLLATLAGAAPPPNILLIMVDDLGPEWISSYGAEDIKTPNIDALAEGGMRFTNAYSMPQCTPTRVTLLTGQYPFRHGWVNHWDVPRWPVGCFFDWNRYTTFARVLRDAGYATAAAGKWQINDFRVHPDAMRRHGFDAYCMWTGFEDGVNDSAERYWDPYLHTVQGSKTYKGQFGTDVFVAFLQNFMRDHVDEPMLLYFPMALTHGPLVPTPDEPNAEGKEARHKAMVRYTDRAVGTLIETLEELGIRERTIVIFTTDNGTGGGITGRMHGRDVRGGKATLREAGCNAPFIVNGPGIVPPGVVTDALTDFTDLFPTIVNLAGASAPEGAPLDGVSIAGVIRGEARDSTRDWILSMGFGKARQDDSGHVVPQVDYADRVIRNKQYKVWIENGKPGRLYDLKNDPFEDNNLMSAKDPDATAALRALEAIANTFPAKDAAPQYGPVR